MDRHRLECVSDIYEAFGKGDMDRIAAALAQTQWIEADGMPYGGHYRGAGEIIQNVFIPIANDVEGFSARPDELLAVGDDRVLALGRYRGTARGGEVDVPFAHLWTVNNSEIVKFVQYADTHKYRQAVGV